MSKPEDFDVRPIPFLRPVDNRLTDLCLQDATIFLCSDTSEYMTDSELRVDWLMPHLNNPPRTFGFPIPAGILALFHLIPMHHLISIVMFAYYLTLYFCYTARIVSSRGTIAAAQTINSSCLEEYITIYLSAHVSKSFSS